MGEATPELEFDDMSWHDVIVYGLQFDVGDASQGDWRSDLVFDIDYIAEWVSGGERGARFRVAPATLTFHEVSDLRIDVDFGDSGVSTMMNELSIANISRTLVDDQKRFPDRDYYRWRIELNWPQGGEITFGGRGFTQTLRADPVLLDEQRLPAGSRR
ncbi:MAG: hypothetical protein GKS02_10680 [Alphaproteobacteria bacterium]|nr:hypothetical protein [Alphaproteobacteria bacterium]